jgi:CRISPR-associated protein Cmr6
MPNRSDAESVPMMFRAQIQGRCQLQYAQSDHSERWTEEWLEGSHPNPPQYEDNALKSYQIQISWRFVTNGGQDSSVIRPVIGAKGLPYYPGSSMKGVFKKACETDAQKNRYCGTIDSPGILRFMGGYPINDWSKNLVDIVHPQQSWQVQSQDTSKKQGGAFVQISLYKPELQFGISSTVKLDDEEWEIIWQIWERALSMGIGCRVCAGYGQPKTHTGDLLYKVYLKGQGQASQLFNREAEFRPNMFRAALRGHALRIFGGLTDANTAENLVDGLFGGISRSEPKVGLIGMMFQEQSTDTDTLGSFRSGRFTAPTYDIEGELYWLLARRLLSEEKPEKKRKILIELIKCLTQFSMIFGGFGKSWRRADHRLFFKDYYCNQEKPLIGCHWQWHKASLVKDVCVRNYEDISKFVDKIQKVARSWMEIEGIQPQPNCIPDWREAWHPDLVQVWARIAEEKEDSKAIYWFHQPYQNAYPSAGIPEGTIKGTNIAGKVNQIGRIWHRMYPIIESKPSPKDSRRRIPVLTDRYLEILTFFPGNSSASKDFLNYLQVVQKSFQMVYGSRRSIE